MNSRSAFAPTLSILVIAIMFSAMLTVTASAQDQAGHAAAAQNSANPSSANQPSANPAGAPAVKPAEEVFKNIQVLKGVPSDQLIPGMQFITAALGVQCEFCHVEGKFDLDQKQPKKTARKMMTMMFALNKDDFDGHREITCNSCHRGATHPVSVPLINEAEAKIELARVPRGPEAAAASSLPAADQIVDKYIQALGGASAIEKFDTLTEKGTASFGKLKVPIEIFAKAPEKRLTVMTMPNAESTTAYDGTAGWTSTPRGLREAHGGDLDAMKMDADLHFALDLKQLFPELKTAGTGKIGNQDVYIVIGRQRGAPSIKFYFDQQSGLLARILRYSDSPLGLNPTEVDYADYRDLNGIKVPYQWTTARPGNQFTIQIEQAQQNVPVDDSKFAKPAPPAHAGMGH
jgi:photosynthetic reaction center cytochrome c subunit